MTPTGTNYSKGTMRVTKPEIQPEIIEEITDMVDESVMVEDFTLSVDFAVDVYALFDEEISKRSILKNYWGLFKSVRVLFVKFKIGSLMNSVEFYSRVRKFLKYFITSKLFYELDRLDPMEALEAFLKMFQPPPPSQPQPQGKTCQETNSGDQKEQEKQGGGDQDGDSEEKEENKEDSKPPKQKSRRNIKDKKGLSADESSLPIDMGKFRKNLPKIEKLISTGIFEKDDVKKYLKNHAGIEEKELKIHNIMDIVSKVADSIEEREMDILYVARLKEITERYNRDKVLSSVPYPDDEMTIKNIDNTNELLRVLPTEFIHDDDVFMQKLIKKELQVKDYQSRRLKKQALYLLIDVSGSMDGLRSIYASGVALSLVRQAVSEGSVYFLRFFDYDVKSLNRITNEEKAERMMETLIKCPYTGGGTNINLAIKTAVKDISEDPESFEKAEIMLITDGLNDVYMVKDNLKGIKLHSTVIEGSNDDLKRLSDTYIELKDEDFRS